MASATVNEQSSRLEKIKNLMKRFSFWIACASAGLMIGLRFVPKAYLEPSAQEKVDALAVGSILALILVALFDIEKHIVQTKKITSFDDFNRAISHFKDQVRECCKKNKPVDIKWLGLDMTWGARELPLFLEEILGTFPHLKLKLKIAMLDPSWTEIAHFNREWAKSAQNNAETLIRLGENKFNERSANPNCLDLIFYRHLPNWHGFLLNERYLYLSKCNWKNAESETPSLDGGGSEYYLIDTRASEDGERELKNFLTWLECGPKLGGSRLV